MDETINPMPPDDPDSERLSESARNVIDAATSRLEKGWRRGNPPDVAELVPADADLATQRTVLLQLVGIDLKWRWKTADATVEYSPG